MRPPEAVLPPLAVAPPLPEPPLADDPPLEEEPPLLLEPPEEEPPLPSTTIAEGGRQPSTQPPRVMTATTFTEERKPIALAGRRDLFIGNQYLQKRRVGPRGQNAAGGGLRGTVD
jgi:hypothetical protein